MSIVILQDEIVHYEVLGRGRPLIFLHSWVGSWRYWVPAMQASSVMFRAYALDLWGFGDSAKNPEKYTLCQQESLLVDFMEKMGILKIGLIGHGLGAIVALSFALDHPEMVDRMMTVAYPLQESMISSRLFSSTPTDLADWLLSRVPASEPARMEAPKADAQAIAVSLSGLQNINLFDISCQAAAACLFVHGQNDPAVLAPSTEEVARLPEHTHQILFEQSGHFPMLDETSKFNRLLADFLSLPSGESPRQLQLKEEWKRRIR